MEWYMRMSSNRANCLIGKGRIVVPDRTRLRVWVMLSVILTGVCGPLVAQKAGSPADSHVKEQMHEAVGAAQHGDETHALELTTTLLDEHPDFGPALKLQGMLLEDMGRSPEAAVPYQKALKLSPNDPELLLKVGIYHLVTGDKDQAISEFVRLLKIKSQDGDALYYLAQAYYLKGSYDLALKAIREGIKVQPNNASMLQKYGELLCSSGDNEAAIRWLLKAQHADPTLDRLDFDLAIASYKGMHLEDSAKYATTAVDVHPNDLNALALLAAVDVKLSHWQEAERIFQKILSVRSDDVSSLLGLGHCELELKNYQASIEALNRLVREDPTQMLAHFYLSRDFVGLGKTGEAQHEADLHSSMMDRASSAASAGDTATEKAIWKKARKMLSENHETDAVQLFRANSRGPSATPGEPYVLVGALYLYMGRPEDAVRNLKRAQEIEPSVLGSHTYLGMLALEEGDLNTAENEFEVDIAHDPTYQMAVAELGEVRYRQGRWTEAVDQLSRSKTVEPTLLYMLCDSYFHLGNIKDADLAAELSTAYAKGDAEFMRGLDDLLNRNHQTEFAKRLANKTAQ
jgi:tetratricopeptide (TPR) repeat protein